ncbi:MAG: hypothetical protein HPY57_15345 [Ignavibacteria bacterium]|nr:hypothetical protein [Ignavibacteria bacterium]
MKVNLILDSSYILYKNVFILKKLHRIKQDLADLLMNDFNKLTKSFAFDNIYFVSDSKQGNWRKLIYKEYKGNRKRDDSIDWDFVYQVFEEFKEKIRNKKNIKSLELVGLEGDDFIGYIVRKSNEKGYSNVILGSDRDLNQLIKYDLNKKFINIQWNYKFSDERIYLPENYQLVIEELSNSVNENIFELDNSSDFVKYIDNLINKTKTKTVVAEEIMFCKILEGDNADNIPSVIQIKDGKVDENGRGIGRDGAATIYKLYKEIHPKPIDIDSDEFVENLSDIIIYHKKIKDITAKDIIKKNIIFNRKLVILDPKYMPQVTYENMKNFFNEVDNRVIKYEPEDLEAKLEEDNFFEEKIPKQFNLESDGEVFNPDSFWEL